MVEGHQCHRVVHAHRRLLLNKKFVATSPNQRFAEGAAAVSGKVLRRIECVGKNLFYFFAAQEDGQPGALAPPLAPGVVLDEDPLQPGAFDDDVIDDDGDDSRGTASAGPAAAAAAAAGAAAPRTPARRSSGRKRPASPGAEDAWPATGGPAGSLLAAAGAAAAAALAGPTPAAAAEPASPPRQPPPALLLQQQAAAAATTPQPRTPGGGSSDDALRQPPAAAAAAAAAADGDNDDGADDGDVVVVHIHFGMAGAFRTCSLPGPDPTPTTRLRLEHAASGLVAHLSAMTVAHGGAGLYADKVAKLGPDPLRPDADPERFWARVCGSRKPIGLLLMDQSAVAGIGNIYRAEVLYKAGLHPEQPGHTLDRAAFDVLWGHCVDLLRRGFTSGSILTVDPEDARALGKPWTRRYIYNQRQCGRCRGPVKVWDMAGRTVYCCETCQPLRLPTNAAAPAAAAGLLSPSRLKSMAAARVAKEFVSHCAPDDPADLQPAKMTCAALRDALRGLNLDTRGTKPQLVARLSAAQGWMATPAGSAPPPPPAQAQAAAAAAAASGGSGDGGKEEDEEERQAGAASAHAAAAAAGSGRRARTGATVAGGGRGRRRVGGGSAARPDKDSGEDGSGGGGSSSSSADELDRAEKALAARLSVPAGVKRRRTSGRSLREAAATAAAAAAAAAAPTSPQQPAERRRARRSAGVASAAAAAAEKAAAGESRAVEHVALQADGWADALMFDGGDE